MIEGLKSAVENREFENNADAALESGGDVAKETAKGPRLRKCKKVCKNDFCKVICAADKDGTHFVKVLVGVVLHLVTPHLQPVPARQVCRRSAYSEMPQTTLKYPLKKFLMAKDSTL